MPPARVNATFRFYAELNDFLPGHLRKREFARDCPAGASVKHMIEALGVPHTEVELILVNGVSVDFAHRIAPNDRISVYPMFEALDISPLPRVRERSLRRPRFVADAHLGGLARLLRLTGYDTLYDNGLDDDDIAALARQRIVLTRDRELLKRNAVAHGCYVHAQDPKAQLREIFARLDLAGGARPLTLCLQCNAPLRAVDKTQVAARLPPRVRAQHRDFTACDVCGRVYWRGSHWIRLRSLLDELLPAVGKVTADDAAHGLYSRSS